MNMPSKSKNKVRMITKEKQYQTHVRLRNERGLIKLGLTASQVWRQDPRCLLFILARYKFVAKMLSGKENVLEIGCGDAFGTRIVQQEVSTIHAIDYDPVFVNDVLERMDEEWQFKCEVHDILKEPVAGNFDAAYAVDVIEHIPVEKEEVFMSNIVASLQEHSVVIIGTPNIESQKYASKGSREGHVNCKNHRELRELMSKFFGNVFIFSMNDEIVHTGFYPMAHYLFGIGVGVRKTH